MADPEKKDEGAGPDPSVEEMMKKGEAGKLTIEDVHYLVKEGHFPLEAFRTNGFNAGPKSAAATTFKLVPMAHKGNMFEEMAKSMEQDD